MDGGDLRHSDELRERAMSGAVWTAAQVWTARLMSAAAFVVLGRTLLPEAFGVVALAYAVISLLTSISDSGLANYLVRQDKLHDETTQTVFWIALSTATFLALALTASAGFIATAFHSPGLRTVLPVLSISIVVTGLSSVPSAILRRNMQFKSLALRGTVSTLSGSVTAVVLALLGAGVWALVAQYIVASTVGAVIVWGAVAWKPRFVFRAHQVGQMLSFGFKLLLIDLTNQARDRSEDFILGGLYSTTTLGYWSVSSRLIRLVQDSGSSVVNAVATPMFARVQNDSGRLNRGYELSMAASGSLLFPAMLFMSVTSKDLIPFVLGRQWASTAQIAQITAIGAAIGVFSYFDRSLCLAVNKLRAEMFLTVFIVSSHILAVVIFAHLGLRALAIALVVRQALTFPLRQLVLHRVVGVPYRCLLMPGRVLLAAGVSSGAIFVGNHFLGEVGLEVRLAIDAAVMMLIYPAAMFLLARDTVTVLVTPLWRRIWSRMRPRSQHAV